MLPSRESSACRTFLMFSIIVCVPGSACPHAGPAQIAGPAGGGSGRGLPSSPSRVLRTRAEIGPGEPSLPASSRTATTSASATAAARDSPRRTERGASPMAPCASPARTPDAARPIWPAAGRRQAGWQPAAAREAAKGHLKPLLTLKDLTRKKSQTLSCPSHDCGWGSGAGSGTLAGGSMASSQAAELRAGRTHKARWEGLQAAPRCWGWGAFARSQGRPR